MKKSVILFSLLLVSLFSTQAICAQKAPPPKRSYNIPQPPRPIHVKQRVPYNPPAPSKHHGSPLPPPPPPVVQRPSAPLPPPIYKGPVVIQGSYPNSSYSFNLGNVNRDGISIAAEAGALKSGSTIEITTHSIEDCQKLISANSHNNRFVPLSPLYTLRALGHYGHFKKPVKYTLLARYAIPYNSRLFILAKRGINTYFIPAKTIQNYGYFVGEIDSAAAYDEIALVADTTVGNSLSSILVASDLDNDQQPMNPCYPNTEEEGFSLSAYVYPLQGCNGSNINYESLKIMLPESSTLDIYKYYKEERIFIQSLPFTLSSSLYECNVDLATFENYYDDTSFNYSTWISFANSNIEDIPDYVIFRAVCRDSEGIQFASEDLIVYLNHNLGIMNSPFSGGNGTKDNPFIITNATQLDLVRDFSRSYFKLHSNIDLRNWNGNGNWVSIGDAEQPFKGLFDGNGKCISNLKINKPNEDYSGLFGYVINASIKNLRVDHYPETMICGQNGGILAGHIENSRIFQCYASGAIKGAYNVGGLVGSCANNSTIRKSIGNCTLSSSSENGNFGGLIGYAESLTITDSFANTEMAEKLGKTSYVGGLVGYGSSTKIQNCYTTGTLNTGNEATVGGLGGYLNSSEIKGNIAINKRLYGGKTARLVGYAGNCSFVRCYAWEHIRDKNNKYLSNGAFIGSIATQEGNSGASIPKDSFFGSKTRNYFWTQSKQAAFNLSNWIFNAGYGLPQLRNMPSLPNPDYLR